MATTHRIYHVTTIGNADGRKSRLVRAANAIQAWRHVAGEMITADLATQDELVELVASGVKVETAGGAASADGQATLL